MPAAQNAKQAGGASAMLRVRLKADGRLVEVLPDGSERAIASDPQAIAAAAHRAARAADARCHDASYARSVRGQTGLTQAAFAARIGVPVETVRNWEQGKRSPRGPARALLKVIERAPEAAFAVLAGKGR
ncbi:MAG: helix-turn-helix domain-containing protein [Xanthobacteraceae bacterium]